MQFLPTTYQSNLFVIFALLIICGIVGSTLAHRSLVVPRITGFMLVGFLFGPQITGLLSAETLTYAKVFIDITLGMIMFNLGRMFVLRRVMATPGLLRSSLAEIIGTFVLIAGGFMLAGGHWLTSLVMAAIGVSASPAIAMMVVEEFNAKGPVVTRSLPLLALNNLAAFALFTALIPVIYVYHGDTLNIFNVLFHPVYLLTGSFALAYGLYWLARTLTRYAHNDDQRLAFPLLIGLLAFSIGLSQMLGLSPLLTSLFLGMMIVNLPQVRILKETAFGEQEEIFLMILFVVAGAKLHLVEVIHYAPWVLLFVALRFGGKLTGLLAMQPFSGTTFRQTLGTTGMLMPMAGLAIGLSQLTEDLFPSLGQDLSALIFACVAVLETLGPAISEWALKLNKEIDAEGLKH